MQALEPDCPDPPAFTVNYGLAGGMLDKRAKPPTKQRLLFELEVHMMLSDAEYHANWGA